MRRLLLAMSFSIAPWLAACASTGGGQDAPRLRVISYNVLVGFGNHRVGRPYDDGATRKHNITAFLTAEQPDVVAFQEMNGYTTARLRTEAAAWGHQYAVMLKERGYPTALTSRYPITVVERKLDGMHHGLMRVRTGDIDFVVVHLWPFKGGARMREVRAALAMFERARREQRPCMMLGDFNAVSAIDVPRFDASARERYAKWKWEVHDNGRPRTDVMDACHTAGLIDVCAKHDALPASIHVPRIDFILASSDLAASSRAARWLADPKALQNSDHPAVVADFGWRVAPH